MGRAFFARQPFGKCPRHLSQFVQSMIAGWIRQHQMREAVVAFEQAQEMVDACEVRIRDQVRAQFHPTRPKAIAPATEKGGEIFELRR